MFAWIHQNLAGEKLLMESLLSNNREVVGEIVGKSFSLVSQTLEERTKQVVICRSNNVVLSFKVSQLLDFYSQTISAIAEESSGIVQTIKRCAEAAKTAFSTQIESETSRISAASVSVAHDLSTPAVLFETLSKLKEIINTKETGMVSNSQSTISVEKAVETLVESAYGCVVLAATELSNSQRSVLLLNATHSILHALESHTDVCKTVIDSYKQKHNELLKQLVNIQSMDILSRCGLQPILEAIQNQEQTTPTIPLSNKTECDINSISVAIKNFGETVLRTGPATLLSDCNGLASAVILMQVRKETAQTVCDGYAKIFEAVTNPSAGYTQPENIFVHTPAAVRELLDCE